MKFVEQPVSHLREKVNIYFYSIFKSYKFIIIFLISKRLFSLFVNFLPLEVLLSQKKMETKMILNISSKLFVYQQRFFQFYKHK